jgi:hypothetical protein
MSYTWECIVVVKEIYVEILTDLHVFRPDDNEKNDFWVPVCQCVVIYVRFCERLAPENLDRFYSNSVSNSLSILGQCTANLNMPTPKTGGLQSKAGFDEIYISRLGP